MPSALSRTKSGAKEIQAAGQLIEAMAEPLDLSSFRDEYREKLEELIERRKHGKTMEVAEAYDDRPPPRTVNLMDALPRSLKSSTVHGNRRSNGHRPTRIKRAVRTRKR